MEMKQNNSNTFADRLYNLRKQNHLTQAEVAERLSVSQVAIHNWESGKRKPDLNKLITLCKTFGVSSEYFLSED